MKYKQCECCGKIELLEKHHIISKCYGGSNKKDNLIEICSSCHTKIHHDKSLIIEGKFMTTEGYKLIVRNLNEESITGEIINNVYKK